MVSNINSICGIRFLLLMIPYVLLLKKNSINLLENTLSMRKDFHLPINIIYPCISFAKVRKNKVRPG